MLTPVCSLPLHFSASSAGWATLGLCRLPSISCNCCFSQSSIYLMPMVCPDWSGHYTKESDTVYQKQSAVTGLGTLPGSQHQPTRHDARRHRTGCVHKWKPWISVNESSGRGSWGCWRLSSICLNQWEKKATRGAQQSEPRPQSGGDCGSHRDNLTTSLPPHLSECWETNRMAGGANS